MRYDFISIGGATKDISFFTDQGILIDNPRDILRQKLLAFEYGAKIRIENFNYTYGGGAANTAVNFANFGFKSSCVAAVGSDQNGKDIVINLKKRGVDSGLIQKKKDINSGFSFVLVSKTGERIIFTERGANGLLNFTVKEEKILSQAKNIYVSSLSGNWSPILTKIFFIAKQKGVRVIWNPSEAQYSAGLKKLEKYLKHTYVFCVNKDEAIELALSVAKPAEKLSTSFYNDEKNLLEVIKSFGPKIVLLTAGHEGAYAYDGKTIYHQPICKEKKRVDVTGVGDVFNSTFAAGLDLYNGDIKKALLLSAKNTASKIAHLGAQNGLLKIKL